MKKKSLIRRFRAALNDLFSTGSSTEQRSIVVKTTTSDQVYKYDMPEIVDYQLVRSLYRNRSQTYAFGAQLVKPIIDSNVSFIGVPTIRSLNDKTNEILNDLTSKVPFSSVHRIAEREGTCYVWPQWDKEKGIKFVIISGDKIKTTYIEPITKEIIGYKIIDKFSYLKFGDTNPLSVEITMEVKKNEVIRTITGDDISLNGKKVIRNPFGFVPIICFINDNEPWENTGHSEIENIEPQIKLYHDVTLEAMHAQRRDGHPKAKITTNSPKDWVDRNYGSGTFDNLAAGRGYISLKDRDLFICKTGNISEEKENIEYIVSDHTTGDYNIVSERTFSNIVEGAQTPEIIFGANMGTSLASVREQRPSYIKKIKKKQLQYEVAWRTLIEASLKIIGFANFEEFVNDLTFSWPTPDFSSDKEKAETLNTLSTSLIKMKQSHIMGDKEIHNTIKKFDIIEVEQDYDKHYDDIEQTADDMAKRLKDETAAQNNIMNQRIATGEYEGNKDE